MFLKLILVVLALFAFYFWFARFWRRRSSFEPGYEEIHYVRSEDGWRIALYRYPPTPKRYETPVLLCHGLGANRFNFDLGPEVSLARYLQQEGFDVWSVDLRGRGRSRKSARGDAHPRAPHVFDDYVRQDAVAAIGHVLGQTGASQVHWIGHSMGGLVLYGVLQGEEARYIASGVTIASPGTFAQAPRIPLVYLLSHALRFVPRIHLAVLAAGSAPLVARIRLPGEDLFVNRNNVEVPVMDRALCYLVSDISGGEISQILDWMKSREFRTHDGRHSYEACLHNVRQPLFLIAGAKDLLVPPMSVEAAYNRIASDKKDLFILGREQGQEEDYGHGDLLIGKNCTREVFPRIRKWLESVESGQPVAG
jgi:pimeloyl-ACP methyl ester carboxylesterase